MHRSCRPLAALTALGVSLGLAWPAPAAVPGPSDSVVVSIAVSSGVLRPAEFPVAGRDCDAVLSELRTKDGFAGRIRRSFEPPADAGRCFDLEGQRSQVAIVCCAPAP